MNLVENLLSNLDGEREHILSHATLKLCYFISIGKQCYTAFRARVLKVRTKIPPQFRDNYPVIDG